MVHINYRIAIPLIGVITSIIIMLLIASYFARCQLNMDICVLTEFLTVTLWTLFTGSIFMLGLSLVFLIIGCVRDKYFEYKQIE